MYRLKSACTGLAFIFYLFLSGGFIAGKHTTPYPFPELKYFPKLPEPPDNPTTVEGAKLGRYLFYDGILSRDSTFACASCHKQENAFSDSPNKFSKGLYGEAMKRNTPALFNLAWHPALFWDGRASSLEEQIFQPVHASHEMNMDWNEAASRIERKAFYKQQFELVFGTDKIDSVLIAKAIAQFLRTLISCNSKYDSVCRGEAEYSNFEFEGLMLVNNQVKGNCIQCHTTNGDVLGTTFRFSNNGLDAAANAADYADKGRGAATGRAADNGKFKVPSLRNVAITGPYMHDGRFKTLEEVLDFYSEGVKAGVNTDAKMHNARTGGMHLTTLDKQKIIAFLNTMTDASFIHNPEFANPFLSK